MESLGQKLQQARLAKKITLDEAARVTKIRQARIQDIEAEDFSNFSSLAYAKGFLVIYAKFLGVDVTHYLDAFETSDHVSVDGYAYLQDPPGGAPPAIARRQAPKRPAFFPFIIAIGVLVLGLYLIKLLLNIQRITPSRPVPGAVASATPQPSASVAENIVAPRALPLESTPASEALVSVAPTATPKPAPPSPTEPEVRRALPVHPEAFATPEVILTTFRMEIKAVRKTYLRVMVDEVLKPAFDGWLDSSDPPLSFQGRHVTVKVLERGAVQITKNGAPLGTGDTDVIINE